jgi:hypothetical protein
VIANQAQQVIANQAQVSCINEEGNKKSVMVEYAMK